GKNEGPLGKWNNVSIGGAANTGENSYWSISAGFTPWLQLSSEAKSKLKKNTTYYLSMYIRTNSNYNPTIKVWGEESEIASKKVTLTKNYQRVDILVRNSEKNPINQIVIDPHSINHSINWDDVTITEISALNPANLSDGEIKEIYKDYSESINGFGVLDTVTFKNIKPLQNYVTKYRVKNRSAIPGLGVIPIDKTLDSGPVNNDGDVKINLRDYSSNGISTMLEKIDIYAVTKDGREIQVYSS
ncbi:TPA: hypothetical protein QCR24_006093, partial [Bacillus cereus]|nr:hypothetical protein [Bacillus cereus]